MKKITRRRFMRESLIIGTAITAFPTVLAPAGFAKDIKKVVLHPNIDNLRVVGLSDETMTRDLDPNSSWKRQNELVVSKVVWENIDKLACGLTKTGNVEEAWRTIFIKPRRKSWPDTVVAIKTNNISRQHSRSAVMAKICHTMTRVLGVKPENIHIYDACHGRNMSRETPFSGLPEGCRIENQWGGSLTSTAIPAPWKKGREESQCVKHLVNGSVDILVNLSMCKGHSQKFGGFTMTMKNHFGTFDPGPGHEQGSLEYLIAINKTPEILGEMNESTGEVLFPRQQLCIVDALWASKGGPGGNPTHQPNYLAMGVLSPVVDYLMATGFRGERMGWNPNRRAARQMIEEFGYNESVLSGKGIIEV